MARNREQGPTEKELAILNVLWDKGPCTVRQVHCIISSTQETGYTTTLKLMQIMIDKGLLVRDDTPFKHVYKPAISKEMTQHRIVENILDKAFAGSAEALIMQALSSRKVSSEELENIRKFLDRMEK
jgi:predicted transcriptional regulator